uniref:Putative conserved plasma membrane protein n=1 Tax=Panstrongylus lignarius TaxID=156445 RepID=A0A224XY52_9HEMI
MSAKDDNDFDPDETAIIKEIYDSENAHEAFGEELERALEADCKIIVIEPPRLGDETARWIAVGNCLHKTAVLSGLGAIVCGIAWTDFPYTYTPLSVMSFFCTGLYTVSWQFDPCVKYQVYTDSKKLAKLPLFNALSSASPTVLIRKNDTKRKILHCSVTLASTLFCALKLYNIFNK